MIPEVHLTEYQRNRVRSEELAASGQLAAGYTELLGEWEVTVALQDRGVEWAFPLGVLYLVAMDEYCAAHWARSEDAEAPSATPAVPPTPDPVMPQRLRRSLANCDPLGELRRAWMRRRRSGGRCPAPGRDA